MIIGLLALTTIFFRSLSTPVVRGQLTSVSGEVKFTGPSGEVSLVSHQPITNNGTIRTIGPDSRATFTLADGTQIKLMGNTTFTQAFDSGKRRLLLTRGALHATVAKQPANAPLVFNSVEATATVRGTDLFLVQENASSYVVVMEGAVAVQRSAGGPEIVIQAGYYTHVEESGPYHSWPIARLPRALRDQVLFSE